MGTCDNSNNLVTGTFGALSDQAGMWRDLTKQAISDLTQAVDDLTALPIEIEFEADGSYSAFQEPPITLTDRNYRFDTPAEIDKPGNVGTYTPEARLPDWSVGYSSPGVPTLPGVSDVDPISVGPAPTVDFTLVPPSSPTPVDLSPISPPAFGIAPIWDGTEPIFDFSGQPGEAPENTLGQVPSIGDLVLPEYTGPADPTLPTLAEITIPSIRDVDLPDMDITFSQIDIPTLSGGVDYTDPGYVPALLDELTTEISRVLNGDLGIPAHLWDAIWLRASNDLFRQSVAREREARRAWARAGWSMPGGVALAQAEQAQQDINEQVSAKALEQAIAQATMEREDFWQAVQHGTALEKLRIDLYNAYEERQLRAAVATVEAMVSVYNALVAKIQAQVQQVEAQIAIKKFQLEGALASLEVDKARLEAAKTQGELNEQLVRIYVAQWEAVKAAIQRYQTEVEAVKTEVEIQKTRIAAYGESVKAYEITVGAWAKQWDGYVAKMDGEKTKAGIYEVESKVFSERMKAFSINADTEKTRVDAEVQMQTLELEKAKQDLERYRTDWEGVKTKLDAVMREYEGELKGYEVGANVQRARLEGDVAIAELGLKRGELDVKLYEGQVQGQSAKASATASTYQARAAGLAALVDLDKAQLAVIEGERDFEIKKSQVDVERFKAEVDGQSSLNQAMAQSQQAEASALGAWANLQDAKVQHDMRQIEINSRFVNARAQTATAKAQLAIEQAKNLQTLQISALESLTQVMSQLTSSMYSAMNVSAQISSSCGFSYGETTQHNYSYEM